MKYQIPWLNSFIFILAGLCAGMLFHYLLYRMTLPSHPFIYVAF